MARYRRKQIPPIVEGMQVTADNKFDIIAWVRQKGGQATLDEDGNIVIPVGEGIKRMNVNDYIIKDVTGTFFVYPQAIFNQLFDTVGGP